MPLPLRRKYPVSDAPIRILAVEDSEEYAEMLHFVLVELNPGQFEYTCVGSLHESLLKLGSSVKNSLKPQAPNEPVCRRKVQPDGLE